MPLVICALKGEHTIDFRKPGTCCDQYTLGLKYSHKKVEGGVLTDHHDTTAIVTTKLRILYNVLY